MLFAENHLASWEQMTGCNIRFIHHADIISHGVSILQAADSEPRRAEAWTKVNIEKNLTILNMHVGRVKFESHGNSLSGMYSSQMFLHNFYNIHHTMQNSILLPKQHSRVEPQDGYTRCEAMPTRKEQNNWKEIRLHIVAGAGGGTAVMARHMAPHTLGTPDG